MKVPISHQSVRENNCITGRRKFKKKIFRAVTGLKKKFQKNLDASTILVKKKFERGAGFSGVIASKFLHPEIPTPPSYEGCRPDR